MDRFFSLRAWGPSRPAALNRTCATGIDHVEERASSLPSRGNE